MKIFGPRPWGPAVDGDAPFVAIPVGTICAWCDEPIAEYDEGVLLPLLRADAPPTETTRHKECHARQILGSVGHQQGLCSCTGGRRKTRRV